MNANQITKKYMQEEQMQTEKLENSGMKLMRSFKKGERFKGEKAAYEIIYSMCCKQGWLVVYKVRRLVVWRNMIGDLSFFFLS